MSTYYKGQLSITDEVYNRIMSRIADGIWREGDKLPSENMLCKKFSVSRVSVRAAMQRLKAHGYISTRHSVGSFVASPRENDALAKSASDITGRDYLELFEFRQAMELRAIDLYVIRASDSEKEDLQKCADGMSANTNELREFT
ncbi:MAG: GntR family transcriptional regulator, partial [Planctomycetota bacterium]|nr:GntR family transcriptional regulator [Planctomycetota bacterium]